MAFPSDYNWKLDITTDSAQVDSNETDFPFYFDLSNISSSDFWNNVQSDGGDLRVSANSDGSTQLPLEVVSIDTGAQTGEIHFKDSTDSSADQTFYLWWDDSTGTVSQPATTDPNGRNAVWTKYEAVWHLRNTSDSTGNGNTWTNNGASFTNAKIGDGADFESSNNEDMSGVTNDFMASGDVSVFAWAKPESTGWQRIIDVDYDGSNRGFQLVKTGGSPNEGLAMPVLETNGTILSDDDSNNSQFSNGVWAYVGGTYDVSADSHTLYVDGSSVASSDRNSSGWSADGNAKAYLASVDSSGGFWDGVLDEVRVSSSVLSNGWISTEYNIQDNNSGFWTLGTPSTGQSFSTSVSETTTLSDTVTNKPKTTLTERHFIRSPLKTDPMTNGSKDNWESIASWITINSNNEINGDTLEFLFDPPGSTSGDQDQRFAFDNLLNYPLDEALTMQVRVKISKQTGSLAQEINWEVRDQNQNTVWFIEFNGNSGFINTQGSDALGSWNANDIYLVEATPFFSEGQVLVKVTNESTNTLIAEEFRGFTNNNAIEEIYIDLRGFETETYRAWFDDMLYTTEVQSQVDSEPQVQPSETPTLSDSLAGFITTTISGTTTLNDTATNKPITSPSENTTLSDSLAGFTITTQASETTTLSDTATNQLTTQTSETTTLSDSLAGFTITTTPSETTTLSDTTTTNLLPFTRDQSLTLSVDDKDNITYNVQQSQDITGKGDINQ